MGNYTTNYGRKAENPVGEIPVENLETRLEHLAEMKMELREKNEAFKESTKHLRESIKALEEIVIGEVTQLGKTVTVGNIKAEFIPCVKIRLKKVKDE